MLVLYELSSYYLFVHLFLLTFHVYHLKSSTPKLTSFAETLGTTAFFTWQRTYRQKFYIVLFLLFLNLGALILMASTQRKAFSQGWFMVFQVFILILFLVSLRREYKCLEESPFYSFGLYFLTTLIYLVGFAVVYAITGEHCYSMNCVVSGEKGPSTCQFCKIIPIFDSSIQVESQNHTDLYALDILGMGVAWGYMILFSFACCSIVVAHFCIWKRPPSEGEVLEEYIISKHLDDSEQEP